MSTMNVTPQPVVMRRDSIQRAAVEATAAVDRPPEGMSVEDWRTQKRLDKHRRRINQARIEGRSPI